MTTLFQRLCWAKQNLPSMVSSKVVAFEDPAYEGAPVNIMTPAPEWLARAMHGHILPPVEAYHNIEYTIEQVGGKAWHGITQLEFEDMLLDFAKSGRAMQSQRVTKHNLHSSPIGPMTEAEAFAYLVQKDTPQRVWHWAGGNYSNYRVMNRCDLPESRERRNSWRLSQDGPAVQVMA